MASVTKTNGVAISADATAETFMGKSLQFLAVVVKNVSGTAQDISAEFGVGEAIDLIGQEVMSKATIVGIQHDATGQISYILEGSAWTASTLQTAVRALASVNSIDCSTSTVTNTGMKLALS